MKEQHMSYTLELEMSAKERYIEGKIELKNECSHKLENDKLPIAMWIGQWMQLVWSTK